MKLLIENNKLKVCWKIPIQVLKTCKKDVDYYSYRASFPIDLKKYIENENSDLEMIYFQELEDKRSCISCSTESKHKSKLTIGKANQLFINLPKRFNLFKQLDSSKKQYLIYELVYVEDYEKYLILVDVKS